LTPEHDLEPIRGLPGELPDGEHIVWQGSPEWKRLGRDAFKTYWIAGYFGALLVWAALDGGTTGMAMTLVMAALGLGLLYGLAWGTARSTVYTITSRRVVLRYGMALPKCINLPISAIASAGLRRNADGSGDIPLALSQAHKLGYAVFWPHVRPWKIRDPEPMLRSIADVETVARLLTDALMAASPDGRRIPIADATSEPSGSLAAA
jgi:Bacterial PH domain